MKCDELKAYIAPTPDGKGLADYYLKSEADREIRKQKRKRCLALAKMCGRSMIIACRADFYGEWQKRWIAIADKFKEACATMQDIIDREG